MPCPSARVMPDRGRNNPGASSATVSSARSRCWNTRVLQSIVDIREREASSLCHREWLPPVGAAESTEGPWLMPALRNPLYEAAAQRLAAGKMADGCALREEAAELGGLDPTGKSFKANARRFCRRKDIRDRVAEIQRVGAELAAVSTGSLLVEAEDARTLAMKSKEPSAANQYIVTKAEKLAGLWRDKVALTDPSGQKPMCYIIADRPMSEAEWKPSAPAAPVKHPTRSRKIAHRGGARIDGPHHGRLAKSIHRA